MNSTFVMTRSFYRDIDLEKECVIPPMSEVVLSSNAKEAAIQNIESKTLSHELQELIGQNQLAYGISLRTPESLVKFFGDLREKVQGTVECASKKIDSSSKVYYDKERKLTSTVANLHSDAREELLPGFTYVLVASMSGSILTRNRNILLRLTTPFLFGVACFSYVLPSTFANTKNLVYDLEKSAFPEFVEKQDKAYSLTKKAVCKTVHSTANFASVVHASYVKVATTVKDWTGLNF